MMLSDGSPGGGLQWLVVINNGNEVFQRQVTNGFVVVGMMVSDGEWWLMIEVNDGFNIHHSYKMMKLYYRAGMQFMAF